MVSKKNLLSIIVCLALTVLVIFLFQVFQNVFNNHSPKNYDYSLIVNNEQYDWTGPKIGEIIALDKLKDFSGNSLSQSLNHSLLVISVIDPECWGCETASDQMQFIQNNLTDNEIGYCVVSFSSKLSSNQLSNFSKKLNLSANSYIWTGSSEEILPRINKMVIPTHLLVNSEGKVLKSFPGTDRDKSIRDQMSKQIIEEVLKEKSKFTEKN